jgi:hypothetical protein
MQCAPSIAAAFMRAAAAAFFGHRDSRGPGQSGFPGSWDLKGSLPSISRLMSAFGRGENLKGAYS